MGKPNNASKMARRDALRLALIFSIGDEAMLYVEAVRRAVNAETAGGLPARPKSFINLHPQVLGHIVKAERFMTKRQIERNLHRLQKESAEATRAFKAQQVINTARKEKADKDVAVLMARLAEVRGKMITLHKNNRSGSPLA